jgi:hypothetical protein
MLHGSSIVVTIVKHHQRYTQQLECPDEMKTLAALQAYHGYSALLYDRDDFQPHSLIADVAVNKCDTPFDDARPAFWLRLNTGGGIHHVLCWTVMDLFETFDMLKLLPNTVER